VPQQNRQGSLSVHSASQTNRQYFRDAYRTGRHGWAVEEPSRYALGFLPRLSKAAPGGALLDLGCGEGRHAIAAADAGLRVTAVDYEPLALLRARIYAKAHGASGINFCAANVLDLPLPDASFDVVLDYGCLHHQRKADWPAYKAGILRVLKPEGHYILSVFSPQFRFFRGNNRKWHIARGAYRRCFTEKDIRGLFDKDFAILELVEEKGNNGGFWHILMRRPWRRQQQGVRVLA
jgi:ubiquinone/menaquinone biosynthesis C-methylase UbiE